MVFDFCPYYFVYARFVLMTPLTSVSYHHFPYHDDDRWMMMILLYRTLIRHDRYYSEMQLAYILGLSHRVRYVGLVYCYAFSYHLKRAL